MFPSKIRCAFLVACLIHISVTQTTDKTVYDNDDRVDVFELPQNDPYRQLAQKSVAAMISRALFQEPDSNGRFDTLLSKNNYPDRLRLQAVADLCDDQKFLKDPTVALCTGTLIAPNKILTAGYCVDESTCPLVSFVFGYYATGRDNNGYPRFPRITAANVFNCQSVLKSWSLALDFAIVTLDREVNTRRYTPVNLTKSTDALELGEELVLIGFPSGTPAKIARGGRVTDPRNDTRDFFYSTVDAFAGNTGSGLFNIDQVQVGVLVRGNEDYVDNGTCNVVNVIVGCNETCGEQATYAFHASVPVNFSEAYEGELRCGENVTGTTRGAPNVVGYESGDRAYSFVLTSPQLVDISACRSDFDTVLRIFDGEGLVELEVCDDCGDCGTCQGCNLLSRLTTFVPAGSYYLVIEGYGINEGDYSISLTCEDVPLPSGSPLPDSPSPNPDPSRTTPSRRPSPRVPTPIV